MKPTIRFCTECDVERPFVWNRCMVCRTKLPKVSKYGNQPKRDASGAMRQSSLEADYGTALFAAQQAGAISNLRSQVRYPLKVYGTTQVDALLEAVERMADAPPVDVLSAAADVGALVKLGRAIRLSQENLGDYACDFVYLDDRGVEHHEDPKGMRHGATWRMFEMKRKLMKVSHGIDVVVPERPRFGRR